MPEVVSVQFRNRGKIYYFDPSGSSPEAGDKVIVETSKGQELGDCVEGVHEVEEKGIVQPLRPVVRLATEEDIRLSEENRRKEAEAFEICQQKIEARGLDMKLVDVEYSFDGSKILFFFTSDGRVDFRELVKDLAGVFHTRIQLMQIGVRDGAKMLGGLGICGRPFCCSSFLEEFQPVSIKMAKTQSLSLNPAKISGTCGRLMCCLKYEQDAYEYLIKTLPKMDTQVDTPQGKGTVTEINLLRRTVKVRLDEGDQTPQPWPADRLGYMVDGQYKQPEPEPLPEPAQPEAVFEEPQPAASERPRERERQRRHGNARKPVSVAAVEPAENREGAAQRQQPRPKPNRHKKSRSNNAKPHRPEDKKAELRQDVLREVMKEIGEGGRDGGKKPSGEQKKAHYRRRGGGKKGPGAAASAKQ